MNNLPDEENISFWPKEYTIEEEIYQEYRRQERLRRRVMRNDPFADMDIDPEDETQTNS